MPPSKNHPSEPVEESVSKISEYVAVVVLVSTPSMKIFRKNSVLSVIFDDWFVIAPTMLMVVSFPGERLHDVVTFLNATDTYDAVISIPEDNMPSVYLPCDRITSSLLDDSSAVNVIHSAKPCDPSFQRFILLASEENMSLLTTA